MLLLTEVQTHYLHLNYLYYIRWSVHGSSTILYPPPLSPIGLHRTPSDSHRTPIGLHRTPSDSHQTPIGLRRTPIGLHRTPSDSHRTPMSPMEFAMIYGL